jgi:hypothetical protein
MIAMPGSPPYALSASYRSNRLDSILVSPVPPAGATAAARRLPPTFTARTRGMRFRGRDGTSQQLAHRRHACGDQKAANPKSVFGEQDPQRHRPNDSDATAAPIMIPTGERTWPYR